MSWDVLLVTDVDGHEVTIGDSFNYTHNCNPMIRDAGLEEWPYGVDGWGAGDLGERLDLVIREMEHHPERFLPMNPENGWGSYEELLPVLRDVRDHCLTYPSAIVWMDA